MVTTRSGRVYDKSTVDIKCSELLTRCKHQQDETERIFKSAMKRLDNLLESLHVDRPCADIKAEDSEAKSVM